MCDRPARSEKQVAEDGPSAEGHCKHARALVEVIGDGVTAANAARRLVAAGHDVELVATRSLLGVRLRRTVDAIYLCVDGMTPSSEAAFDLESLQAAAAALRMSRTENPVELVVVHGKVAPGTTDWLQHLLSARFETTYMATCPDARHGGAIIGADTRRAAARVADLERFAGRGYALLSRRGAEMADIVHRTIAAADDQVARELRLLSPGAGAGSSHGTTEPQPARSPAHDIGAADTAARDSAVSTLVALAELARQRSPTLHALAHQRGLSAAQLPQMATGRTYLASLAEQSVASAGPQHVDATRASPWYPIIKRALDLVVATLTLPLLLPPMLLIAALIMLESGRPAIFRARRVGRNGEEFDMLKFRSLRTDAPRTANKSETEVFATRIGRLLRASSLDELPQLFNLLKGQMSLVGPRPEQPFIADWYQPWQRERLTVPPGLTGWWQINMRGHEGEMYTHVEYDVWYVRHRSLLLDLAILLRTPLAICGLAGRRRRGRR